MDRWPVELDKIAATATHPAPCKTDNLIHALEMLGLKIMLLREQYQLGAADQHLCCYLLSCRDILLQELSAQR